MSTVRYLSLGPLLAGAGSRAFLGLALEDGLPPRPVVLIWAPQEVVQSPELTAKLTRETGRALVFEHPNILRVHSLAAQDGGLARVTEFADGEPLRRVLEASPRLPPPLAALVAADAATGLHYAHMAGNDDGSPLVHGDVRPETLMLSFSGLTKVTGYGALSVAPRERDGKRVKNRRAYSAPEQLLGGREAVNVQSDVFLLGLVLHECLSGKMPFKDNADPDKATLTRTLPTMSVDVPLKLDAVVRKATAKRAYDRYPSAHAFREAIVEAVGTLPAHTSLADYLAKLFPPENEARAARRRVIEAGIADVLQKVGVAPPAVAEFLVTGTLPPSAIPKVWPAMQGQLSILAAMSGGTSGVQLAEVSTTTSPAPSTESTGSSATVAAGAAPATEATSITASNPTLPAVATLPATGSASATASTSTPDGTSSAGVSTTSTGTPADTVSATASAGTPAATGSAIASAGTPSATGSATASAGAPTATGSATASAGTPTATGSATASAGTPAATESATLSSGTPAATVSSGPSAATASSTMGAAPLAGTSPGVASGAGASGVSAPQAGAVPASGPVPPTAGTPRKSSRAWLAAVGVGTVLALGGAAVIVQRLPPRIEAELEDAGPPSVAMVGLDTDAGTSADSGVDAGAEVIATGFLDLTVDPRVDVSYSGGFLGRTPLSVALPAGRHVLTLTNAVLGIQVARTFTITAGGRNAQQIFLNKGFINVRAPKDAIVTLNGRLVGAAPVEEQDVYEGTHQLLVIANGARWQKTFKLEPGQRVSFDVDFESPSEE
ncbi:protein kinase [Myxococcus llanfairpwllgwyngyllgogerychwyrndrobwllllantysiliogogogochensis]|uniref:non-specific serine/threonine protein kinase n=1 Tax=Myxococcus llanfairpwllgwyngyllgogerychwyrndrobwllllantysiliogogogochensis TaxID=2590453 RepID=A0A540WIJ7_9BACT|nr:protein kinase [Myxococcus llanfairpwllgwyngyllgogerychwyrndrobwllllantysiliogogogochensis]TQF08840.1 protein kinase [Myxococcus llanfairpwllgwyngyllgogerychwyrndrobwllllantysiliogogogochensis]